jgi:hypothetical protein
LEGLTVAEGDAIGTYAAVVKLVCLCADVPGLLSATFGGLPLSVFPGFASPHMAHLLFTGLL